MVCGASIQVPLNEDALEHLYRDASADVGLGHRFSSLSVHALRSELSAALVELAALREEADCASADMAQLGTCLGAASADLKLLQPQPQPAHSLSPNAPAMGTADLVSCSSVPGLHAPYMSGLHSSLLCCMLSAGPSYSSRRTAELTVSVALLPSKLSEGVGEHWQLALR